MNVPSSNDPQNRGASLLPRAERSQGSALLVALVVVAVAGLAAAAAAFYLQARRLEALHEEVGALRTETGRLTARVELFRLEQSSEGKGIDAVVDQIEHFAHGLTHNPPKVEEQKIRQRLDDAIEALGTLGPQAFDALVVALEEQEDDLVASWLLHAMMRTDERRGVPVAASVVRGTRFDPSPRLRNLATKQLKLFDRDAAAGVLEELLLSTSARGVSRNRLPSHLRGEYEGLAAAAVQTDSFHNFVRDYLDCEPENAARTLTQIIGRDEHDKLTVTTAIKGLGELGHRPATDRIIDLYHRPPGNFADPLFRQNCLRAIGEILGKDACGFFQEELLADQHELVRATLTDLVKRYDCGGT